MSSSKLNLSKFYSILQFLSLIVFLCMGQLFGAVTGKISGQVTDINTGEPLIGANVVLEGTSMGAATDIEGYFVILNIDPGKYSIRAMMIGFTPVNYTNVRVNVDLTTTVDFGLQVEIIQGEEIEVIADRKIVKEDVASSQINISSDRIDDLPVTTVEGVIGLQAGVENMSVRQGSTDELAVMLDGIGLKDDRTGEPISGIPLSSVEEIMIQSGGFNAEYSDLQSGIINVVTKKGNVNKYTFDINYRYSPAAPKHFGMSPFDPDSYFLRPYLDDEVCWTGTTDETFTDQNGNKRWDEGESFIDTNNDGQYYLSAWNTYQRRQYPSFDGWNAVSERLLSDDDPTNDLSPTGAQRLFLWEHRRQGDITEPDYDIDIGFGGPFPVISRQLGNLRFHTAYRGQQSMYLVPFSRDRLKDWSMTTQITSDITANTQLTFSGFVKETETTNADEIGGPSNFRSVWGVADAFAAMTQEDSKLFYPSYWCLMDISNRMYSIKMTNMLSAKSFIESSVEYASTEYFTRPLDERNREPLYDIFPGDAIYLVDEAPYGFETSLASKSIDGFMMGAKSNARDSTVTSHLKFKVALTDQINRHNQVKVGVNFSKWNFNMNYGAINPELPGGRPWTKWKRSPYQLDIYIQDKLEFKGWIATLGLRAEYVNPNGEWYDLDIWDAAFYSSQYSSDVEDTFPTKAIDGNLTLMPRVGISHPITENSKFYFNYGHMRQKFDPDFLFGVRRSPAGDVQRIGDPNMPMEKTVGYELGYDQSLFDKYLIHLAGYYKDKSDQASRINYIGSSIDYDVYSNIFYQDIRGLELELRKQRGTWLTGFVNYTYSVYSSGYFGIREWNQDSGLRRDYLKSAYNTQKQSKPLPRPKLNYNLTFHTPNQISSSFVLNQALGGWKTSFTGYWKSGAYYTVKNYVGITNNMRYRDTYTVNLKMTKAYKIDKLTATLICEVYNLFNFKHFSSSGYGDRVMTVTDRDDYANSLHFPARVYEEIGQNHISGNDRMGDYRKNSVAFQPMTYIADTTNMVGDPLQIYYVGDKDEWMQYILPVDTDDAAYWETVDKSRIKKLLDNKAYIDNPNNLSFLFLNPRDFYFGIRLSYEL